MADPSSDAAKPATQAVAEAEPAAPKEPPAALPAPTATTAEPPKKPGVSQLLVVFLTVLIDLLGFGIVIPLLPIYSKAYGASEVELGLLFASFSAMQFVFAPFWGRLSDRIGRRPVLVGGLFGTAASYALFAYADSMPLLYLSLIFVKTLHEFGHAYFCRKWGGEVHIMGVMLMIFTPVPYVDATSSWGFRSHARRALVGAAGMIVEVFLAAIAAFIWASTAPGVIHSVAYNIMFVASVSTLIFNLNPLLRFDGADFFDARTSAVGGALGLPSWKTWRETLAQCRRRRKGSGQHWRQ